MLDEIVSRRLLTAGEDYEGWTASPGRAGEPHTNALLDAYPGVAVSRAVQKQGWFYDRVEGVLLSILIEVLVARVTTRTNSPPREDARPRDKIREDIRDVEPSVAIVPPSKSEGAAHTKCSRTVFGSHPRPLIRDYVSRETFVLTLDRSRALVERSEMLRAHLCQGTWRQLLHVLESAERCRVNDRRVRGTGRRGLLHARAGMAPPRPARQFRADASNVARND